MGVVISARTVGGLAGVVKRTQKLGLCRAARKGRLFRLKWDIPDCVIGRRRPYGFFVLIIVSCPIFPRQRSATISINATMPHLYPGQRPQMGSLKRDPSRFRPWPSNYDFKAASESRCASEFGEVVLTKLVRGHPILGSGSNSKLTHYPILISAVGASNLTTQDLSRPYLRFPSPWESAPHRSPLKRR
jgi:hypothetical protein